MNVDLGCGPFKKSGFVGIDVVPNGEIMWSGLKSKADVCADLDKGIPLEDNSVEEVYCSHCMEHLENPISMLREIQRVCKNGTLVQIIIPLYEPISTGHKQMFPAGWFERYAQNNNFKIERKEIREKNITTDIGIGYWIIEGEYIFRVIK